MSRLNHHCCIAAAGAAGEQNQLAVKLRQQIRNTHTPPGYFSPVPGTRGREICTTIFYRRQKRFQARHLVTVTTIENKSANATQKKNEKTKKKRKYYEPQIEGTSPSCRGHVERV